jgi:hypothetical protein
MTARPGVLLLVNQHKHGILGILAMALACLFGLACATVGDAPGLLAAAWIGTLLLLAWHPIAPTLGTTTLGLAAIYALAARSAFAGSDPEDVDGHWNLRLAVVALGCAAVGVTSTILWLANRARRAPSSTAHEAG